MLSGSDIQMQSGEANSTCDYLNTLVKQGMIFHRQGLLKETKQLLSEFQDIFHPNQVISASYIELNLFLLNLIKLREELHSESVALWVSALIKTYEEHITELPDFIWEAKQHNELFLIKQRHPELNQRNNLAHFDESALSPQSVGTKAWRRNLDLLTRYREQSEDYPLVRRGMMQIIQAMATRDKAALPFEQALYCINEMTVIIDDIQIAISGDELKGVTRLLQALNALLLSEHFLQAPDWLVQRIQHQLQQSVLTCETYLVRHKTQPSYQSAQACCDRIMAQCEDRVADEGIAACAPLKQGRPFSRVVQFILGGAVSKMRI